MEQLKTSYAGQEAQEGLLKSQSYEYIDNPRKQTSSKEQKEERKHTK